MRISDWSSDVCSSDLVLRAVLGQPPHRPAPARSAGPQLRPDPVRHRPVPPRLPRLPRHRGPARRHRRVPAVEPDRRHRPRSEEHTSELQSLMRISYAVFCLKKKKISHKNEADMINQQKYTYTKRQTQTITTRQTINISKQS